MLKTTQEAEKMYCPLNGIATINIESIGYCDGEKCMMWRNSGATMDGKLYGYCGLVGESNG